MTLAPLLAATPVIRAHAVAALGAFVLGLLQLLLPKGTSSHRALGYLWVALMLVVTASSFAIRTIAPGGGLSWIHALSAFTLLTLPLAVVRARRHRVRAHAIAMIMLFTGALVIAGAFTLLPSRIMGRVVFGA